MLTTTVTLIGNATRDPEVRYTPSGATVANFGIAVNKRRKDGDEWVDADPEFYDVKCWGSLAENVADSIQKGVRVLVTGELEFRTWETDDGEKRSKIEVVAEAVGPDLRWATASVQRSQGDSGSRQGGNRSGGNRQPQGRASQQASPFGGGSGDSPFGGGSSNPYDDEEPF